MSDEGPVAPGDDGIDYKELLRRLPYALVQARHILIEDLINDGLLPKGTTYESIFGPEPADGGADPPKTD